MNTQYGANIRKEFNFNQGEALYIINSKGIEYHQAAGKCTLKRDEMQKSRPQSAF